MADYVELNGKRYDLDFQGCLQEFEQWTPELMTWLAEQEQIALTDDHRQVIDILRHLFEKTRALPVLRSVTAEMEKRLGREKGTIKCFHTLFPGGIHHAYKIAGLPRLVLSV